MTLFQDLRSPLRTVLGFSLVINLALLAPSIFMLQVFDRVLATQSVETLVVMALIAGATLALMGLLDYQRGRALGAIGVLIEQRHGPRLLKQLLTASARSGGRAYLDGMRDLASVRGFLAGSGIVALCDAPWTLVYLVLIYLFHPALGLMATASVVYLVLLAWVNERITRDTIAKLQDGSRQAARFVEDALRNAEVVTALGMPGAVTRRWNELIGRNHALQVDIGRLGGLVGSLSRTSRQLVQIAMLGFGAFLVIHEGATPGVMLATTIILARALAPVEQLIGGWKGLVEARASLRRLREALARPTEGAVGTELPRPTGRLSVEGVVYTPPGAERPLLRGVSLQAAPGTVLAVVGPSGSGKTTLVRLLVGVTQPAAGAVRLDGADLRGWDPGRLGAWIGYLPQDVELFAGTVAENISHRRQRGAAGPGGLRRRAAGGAPRAGARAGAAAAARLRHAGRRERQPALRRPAPARGTGARAVRRPGAGGAGRARRQPRRRGRAGAAGGTARPEGARLHRGRGVAAARGAVGGRHGGGDA